MKTIGILGGMGPEGTSDMYMKIIRIFQKRYGAKYDKDYPPILIYSLPIPDVVEIIEDEKIVIQNLVEGVKKLEKAGADFIIIACNTVQYYIEDMRKSVSIPILSMMEETAKIAKDYKRVGLLGTDTTKRKRLFENEFDKKGIDIIVPDRNQQKIVSRTIMNVLAGEILKKDSEEMKKVVESLDEKGAEAIILGCTDLPIIMKQEDYGGKLLDTTDIMAEVSVKKVLEVNKNEIQTKDKRYDK